MIENVLSSDKFFCLVLDTELKVGQFSLPLSGENADTQSHGTLSYFLLLLTQETVSGPYYVTSF